MLLAQLTESLQSNYATIQSQIDALLEQQRHIQAQLQRVGSTESKMESAVALLQEAIAQVQEVCPGELQAYQSVVNSLFTVPLAQLPEERTEEEADSVADVSESPNPEEAAPASEDVTEDGLDITTIEAEAKEVAQVANENVPAGELHRQTTRVLTKLATSKGIDTIGMKRHQIATALTGKVTRDELPSAANEGAYSL